MGKTYPAIDDKVTGFIAKQKMFFVATAPLAGDGHINLSPRGLDSLRILDEQTVAWLDLTGSGAETIAHLRENGRIVLMFCAFEGPPNILRLHGRGEVVLADDPEFAALAEQFPPLPGARAIIRVHCERISDSCGFGVPRYEFQDDRPQLIDYSNQKGPDGMAEYRRKNNQFSIDGLPALDV